MQETTDKLLYSLNDSLVVEPLINKWSAWVHLIPPVVASLHLQNYQMRLMESYSKSPEVHYEASCQPDLFTGPFIHIPVDKVNDIRKLMENTKIKLKENLKLAESVISFYNQLTSESSGDSLDSFYHKLPEPLQGYVELVYDYYNHPIIRFSENLFYESKYYDSSLQSLRIFQLKNDNDRPYIMNTPRLINYDDVNWAIPFNSELVDRFFKLDIKPQPLVYIRELLNLSVADEMILKPFLSTANRYPSENVQYKGTRIRYFGHACVLVETDNISILTDPYIGAIPSEAGMSRLSYRDLPEKIDYVIITHNHHDHFCLETLIRLRHRVKCLIVPRSSGMFYGDISLRLLAKKIGFKNVVELDPLESTPFPNGEIIGIPFLGEHADLPHSKSAYVVRIGNEKILFAADSDCLDKKMYEHIAQHLGYIQTIFIGMECVGAPLSWSCGSLLPIKPTYTQEQSRRYKGCNAARAWDIIKSIGANRIYIYAMGLEPWLLHLLGLSYREDSIQLKEARNLLIEAREMGYEIALLNGSTELCLNGKYFNKYNYTNKEHVLINNLSSEAKDLSITIQDACLIQDQFVFDKE
jgi:L-ascorbate metabolism protein UlaG (beta-lactamase superfamily)